jgi:hypothetical protein
LAVTECAPFVNPVPTALSGNFYWKICVEPLVITWLFEQTMQIIALGGALAVEE